MKFNIGDKAIVNCNTWFSEGTIVEIINSRCNCCLCKKLYEDTEPTVALWINVNELDEISDKTQLKFYSQPIHLPKIKLGQFIWKTTPQIKTIQVNEKKRIVTVVFENGTEVIRCSKEDNFDVNIGVALAIAQHIYGSKTAFHKYVQNKAKYINSKK